MCWVWDELAAMPCASELIVGPFRLGWYHSMGASRAGSPSPRLRGCPRSPSPSKLPGEPEVSGESAKLNGASLQRERGGGPQPPLSIFSRPGPNAADDGLAGHGQISARKALSPQTVAVASAPPSERRAAGCSRQSRQSASRLSSTPPVTSGQRLGDPLARASGGVSSG